MSITKISELWRYPIKSMQGESIKLSACGPRGLFNVTDGVDCFEKNRDTTSSVFANGVPKIISNETIKLFTATERYRFNSCEGPDFQDAHSIGAVIAHGMMRLYGARAKISNASSEQQAGWLLNVGVQPSSSARSLCDLLAG